MTRQLSSDAIESIRAALLAFFDTAARPLPWRTTSDPYAIWVSEVMAQQTRVETAIPYYERWLCQFPDVATLANAPIDAVLKAWEGLGYYSRARNLHSAALVVRERHQGAVPESYEALRALPGVGEYTAGAIASIAFGARRPAVDGNVRRVLSRVLDEPAPSAALLRDVAGTLVPADRPGDFNQAVMELGATICAPKSPRCHICPIAPHCRARAAGTQADRPAARRHKPVPLIDIATAVIHDGAGRLLVARRPATGLLARLWNFPGVETGSTDGAANQAREIALRFASACGEPRPIGVIEHTFSHRRERYSCFMVDGVPVALAADDVAWIDGRDSHKALPRAQQRILAMALAVIEERQMR